MFFSFYAEQKLLSKGSCSVTLIFLKIRDGWEIWIEILQHLITYKTILVFLLLKLFSIEIFPLPQLRNSILVSCNWKAVSKWKQGVISHPPPPRPPKCAHYVVISWKIKNHSRSKDWNFLFYLDEFVFSVNVWKTRLGKYVNQSVQLGNLFSK